MNGAVDVEERDAVDHVATEFDGRTVEAVLTRSANIGHLHVIGERSRCKHGSADDQTSAGADGAVARYFTGIGLCFVCHRELYYRIMENRRAFSVTIAPWLKQLCLGANDRIRLGLVDSGGRRREHGGNFLKQLEVLLVAVLRRLRSLFANSGSS